MEVKEKVKVDGLNHFTCTRCKRKYDTYASRPAICDRSLCYEKGQERLNRK